MKKIVITENANEKVAVKAIECADKAENVFENQKYNAFFSHSKGDMVSFKAKGNEIKLKYLSNKNIDINPQFDDDNKTVIYEDVEDGIDLKYELQDRKLKESFVIKERNNNYIFNFETEIGSLVPSYNQERKCLEFKKDDKVVCRMLPPFMTDNRGEESKNCSYEVENNENGKLSIKLVADTQWINSEERELPIIIDPTFEIVTPSFNVYEITQGTRIDAINCENGEVIVGHKKVDGEIMFYQTEIQVESGVLCENDLKHKAIHFEMPVKNFAFQNNDKIIIMLFGVTEIFNAKELFNESKTLKIDLTTYLNKENIDRAFTIKICMISDPLIAKTRGDIYEGKTFDGNDYFATILTKDSGQNSTCKIVFASDEEEVVMPNIERTRARPKQNSNEYVDYDIGISGVTSVNIQSKIFKHTINDLSIKSGTVALDINHIYNSISNMNGAFGEKWTLSVLRKLKKTWNGYTRHITYIDDNGIEHVFYEKWYYKDGETKKYVRREDVTLSENNELMYIFKDSNNITKKYKVEYELINDDGFEYVSLGSATNYDFKKKEYKYYINYNGFKKEVIFGQNNYLQFVFYSDNGMLSYLPNTSVYARNGEFLVGVKNNNRCYLYNKPTKVYFENGNAIAEIYNGGSSSTNEPPKNFEKVVLEKVAVYENLDEDLYTSAEIENLEHEMLQAKRSLKELNEIIERGLENEAAILGDLQNCNYSDKNIRMEYDTSKNPKEAKEDKYYEDLKKYNDAQNRYRTFLQVENELISAYAQKANIERNEYFVTRSFNSKIREQKESANDYIIDSNGKILMFDGYGRMIGVMDKYENRIEISYDDDSNIQNIKSEEEQIDFKYNENKKLESIKKSNGDVVRFNYFMDSLIEIDNNGRKTTFIYMNGFQVYSDNDDEIIIDNQTHNVLKIKKYAHQGTIDQNTTFMANPFVARDLITNDMFEYLNNFTCTKITERIKNDSVTLEFDDQSNVIKKYDDKEIIYSNYDSKDRLISSISMNNDLGVLFPNNDNKFNESNNKFSLFINSSRPYSNKTNAYCLKVELNDYAFVNTSSNLNKFTLSVYYMKSSEKYNFKQTFPIKENDVLVLPFFLEGYVSNFEANVESNLSSSETIKFIKKITINEVKSGVLQEYDEKDRLWKIKTNEGKTTYLVFDDKLPIHVEFKDWNGKATTTDYLYDCEGKVTNSVDSKGNCEAYLYQNKGNKVEKKSFCLKDASLVRSEISEYDTELKTYLEKGNIKDKDGNYPERKTIFYPGNEIVKTEIGVDGSKTEYIIDPRSKRLIGLIKENDGIKNSISYIYNCDFLTTVKNNGTTINYTYDGSKRIKTIKIQGYSYTFISNTYSKDPITVYGLNGKSYANGSTVTTSFNGGIYKATSSYDKEGTLVRLIQTDNTNTYTSNYEYNEEKLITDAVTIKTGDNAYKETNKYTYDVENKVTSFVKEVSENETTIETIECSYTYSSNRNLTKLDLKINGALTESSVYTYNTDKLLTKEVINSECTINYEYDALNRVHHKEIKNNNNVTICRYFSYLQQDGNTLDLIAEDNVKVVSSSNGYLIENRKYNYDVNGRVIEINIDDKKTSYEYDASGRLIKERNKVLGVENKYSYDRLSNITSKRTYDLATNTLTNEDELVYSCDGRHLLVSINNTPVTSDIYGRITSYNGKSLIWNKDGSLKNISLGEDSIEYSYNDKGIRYLKSSNGVTTRFVLDGNKILREKSVNHSIDYLYSTSGIEGFKYNNETYLYEKNIFGDIIRIYNKEGDIVGEYAYDAFGNVTIVTDINGIATINPFRYRGYYYDSDTGLYYLNYRYYDPKLCRFISPDDASYINPNNVNGLNIYAYCNNDPINYADPSGHFAITTFLIGLAISSLVGWGISELCGEQIAGGIGSCMNGAGAICTGFGLLAFGPVGWILGGALILVGAGTVAFGVNDVVTGITGTNYMQSWTGMSDELYTGLKIAFNTVSAIGTIAGNIGMRIASNHILNNIVKNPADVQKYKLWKLKTYGKYSSQYVPGTLKRGGHIGQGYTLTNVGGAPKGYIQYHPGSFHHFDGAPYLKVTSSLFGTWRGLYLF